jgi:hypothetical protein
MKVPSSKRMSWVVLGRLEIKRCEGKVTELEFVSVLGRVVGPDFDVFTGGASL